MVWEYVDGGYSDINCSDSTNQTEYACVDYSGENGTDYSDDYSVIYDDVSFDRYGNEIIIIRDDFGQGISSSAEIIL